MTASNIYLDRDKTYAFPQRGAIKRAALLFDRLYGSYGYIPEEIQFYVPEVSLHSKHARHSVLRRLPQRKDPARRYTVDQVEEICIDFHVQTVVECYRRAGYVVVPIYDHQRHFLKDFPEGDYIVYQAALENLPDVVEQSTSWDHILEFRRDKEALRKYRSLHLWLRESLKAKTITEAKDIIAHKVDDYEWALRKHGFKTTIGAISSILDWRGLTSIMGASGLAGMVAGPIWSAVTAGFVTAAHISVWVAERMIDKKEIERTEGSEVAIIYEAKKRLIGKRRNT